MIFSITFFLSAILFLSSVIYGMYSIHPILSFIIPVLWVSMALGSKYAMRVMISIDQTWQTVCAPLFNLWKHAHRFGNPDETASSVIGKNLKATGLFRYKAIEFFLMWIFEGGKPHSIKSIEHDENQPKD